MVSLKVFNLESMTGFLEPMGPWSACVCVCVHARTCVCMLYVHCVVCACVCTCPCVHVCRHAFVCVCEYTPVHFWKLVRALQSHFQRHTDPRAQVTDKETEVQRGPERVQVPPYLCPGLMSCPSRGVPESQVTLCYQEGRHPVVSAPWKPVFCLHHPEDRF